VGCGISFRFNLLHAVVDRLPVIGDWFCHLRASPAQSIYGSLFFDSGRLSLSGHHIRARQTTVGAMKLANCLRLLPNAALA
jgi:hypothetical protein